MESQAKVQQNIIELMSQQRDGNNNNSNFYYSVGMPLINNMNLVRSREMVAMATPLILLLMKRRPKKVSRDNDPKEDSEKSTPNTKKIVVRFLLGLG